MMTRRLLSTEHWEDWFLLALGLFLWVSPWLLQFSADMLATQNAFLVGLLLVVSEAVILSAFRPWEEWINVAIGGWLVISAFLLGITSVTAQLEFVVIGLLVLGVSLYEIWDLRHRTGHAA